MAWCYHDAQDFKSDLIIEVAREGDILEAGTDLKDIKCDKNPGHRDFIPFKDLILTHLPIEIRNSEILDHIKKLGKGVVKLVVDKSKLGSGFVYKLNNEYFIKTNNHVVKTDDDVKHCIVEFHYDDDSRSNVLTSRGVKLVDTCPFKDITTFTFHPVPVFLHQLDWTDDKQPKLVFLAEKNNQINTMKLFLTSTSSRGWFFIVFNLNSSMIDVMFITSHDGYISYLKSCYFKFRPISSNIQELAFIEIHIDEDNGNSRVILGDVVKFGYEFVVRIPESIFQNEVKKCKLVWNGEVIGRGTRLYFKQVKSSDIYSGIDLEQQIQHGVENQWIIELDPIPRNIEVMINTESRTSMCCIGHPHGGIKMVTLGPSLGDSVEKFDNQGRHIRHPHLDCECKDVACMNYSCKTCPGSSGSPVLPLYNGMEWRICFVHFMGKPESNGEEEINNINSAWVTLIPRENRQRLFHQEM